MLQKLDANGKPQWASTTLQNNGIIFTENKADYTVSDLHASDNGSVIVSFSRDTGFRSNRYLYANKFSASGKLLWGRETRSRVGRRLVAARQFSQLPSRWQWRRGVFLVQQQSFAAGLCAAHQLGWSGGVSSQRGRGFSTNALADSRDRLRLTTPVDAGNLRLLQEEDPLPAHERCLCPEIQLHRHAAVGRYRAGYCSLAGQGNDAEIFEQTVTDWRWRICLLGRSAGHRGWHHSGRPVEQ